MFHQFECFVARSSIVLMPTMLYFAKLPAGGSNSSLIDATITIIIIIALRRTDRVALQLTSQVGGSAIAFVTITMSKLSVERGRKRKPRRIDRPFLLELRSFSPTTAESKFRVQA